MELTRLWRLTRRRLRFRLESVLRRFAGTKIAIKSHRPFEEFELVGGHLTAKVQRRQPKTPSASTFIGRVRGVMRSIVVPKASIAYL